jgi:hypothetical protein
MGFASSSAGGKSTVFCPWVGLTKPTYLGLKFVIKGKTHFGWARIGFENGTTLTGYAYETIPNKPIITGKTKGSEGIGNTSQPSPAAFNAPTRTQATPGMLALGWSAPSIWRRRSPRTNPHEGN